MTAFTPKQTQTIAYANKPYNIQLGARGGGKTYTDILVTIPSRIEKLRKHNGLFLLCGNTLENIDDNILNPMRDYWGDTLVPVRKLNSSLINLFGVPFRLVGGAKSDRVNVLRGKNILYAYCDEVVTYNYEFFTMLITGLRCTDASGRLVSIADFTCNPDTPAHWFKQFIDKQLNSNPDMIYVQHYTIYDNPFLSKQYVKNLEDLYRGTVYFDRYIKGLWTNAEGIIFRQFADNPNKYIKENQDNILKIHIGVDFGGAKAKTIIIASGIIKVDGIYKIVVLEEHEVKERYKGAGIDIEQVAREHFDFYQMLINKYKVRPEVTFCDHLDLAIVQMRNYHKLRGSNHKIDKVNKSTISLAEYIQTINSLLNIDKLFFLNHTELVINSFTTLLYDEKQIIDAVLDDNVTCDVDTYDATRYSISNFLLQNNIYKWIIKIAA